MEQKSDLVKENPLRKIKIEKVVLSVGGIGENLEKGVKLLSIITGRKPAKMISKKKNSLIWSKAKIRGWSSCYFKKKYWRIFEKNVSNNW